MNQHTEGLQREMIPEAKRHFLAELREARSAAQKDAEAFDELLFVFERVGSFLLGRVATLGDYKSPLTKIASQSALSEPSQEQSAWHTRSDVLFQLVKDARNDALHQGARARYLTGHSIEFALLLEDSLMNGAKPMTTVGDIMVRSPVTAEEWQPISLVRKLMLVNSFSYLPIRWENEWRLVSDVELAVFLRKDSPSNGERKKRLALPLEEAHGRGLRFEIARSCVNSTQLSDIAACPLERPLLVLDKPDHLVGIVTAFDIL